MEEAKTIDRESAAQQAAATAGTRKHL